MNFKHYIGIGVVAWVGWIIYKNRSLTKGIAEVKGDLVSLKNKVAGMVSQNAATPTPASTTVPPDGYLGMKQLPESDAHHLNFVQQPYGFEMIQPFGDNIKNNYDTSGNATTTPSRTIIYE